MAVASQTNGVAFEDTCDYGRRCVEVMDFVVDGKLAKPASTDDTAPESSRPGSDPSRAAAKPEVFLVSLGASGAIDAV